jgi:hypothetical protein
MEEIAGGLSMSGDANKNTVVMTGGAVNGGEGVVGGAALGFTGEGSANENIVRFGGTAVSDKYLLGGFVREGSGSANSNKLVIDGGVIGITGANGHGAYGGFIADPQGTGAASNNEVTFNDGLIKGSLYGGAVMGSGDATGNIVIINGGVIESPDLTGAAYGGFSMGGEVVGNKVYFNGGTIKGDEDENGGRIYGGAGMGDKPVSKNTVVVTGGFLYTGPIGGIALASGLASDNIVEISGGEMLTAIGGFSMSGDAVGNKVFVSGGHIIENVAAGLSFMSNADRNKVVVSGGDIDEGVTGGLSFSGNTDGNELTISGGAIAGLVVGGFLRSAGGVHQGQSINNIITISGSADLSGADLYGGQFEGNLTSVPGTFGGGDLFSGNTLNVFEFESKNVQTVGNFEFLNFIVPPSVIKSGGPVLNSSGAVTFGDGGSRESKISISTLGKSGPLDIGSQITVVNASSYGSSIMPTTATGSHGVVLDYEWTLALSGTNLNAKLKDVSVNPKSKALNEGALASVSLINQAADLVSTQGIAQAVSSAAGASGRLAGFFGMNLGSQKYKTGSHVDVDSISFLTGLAWLRDLAGGKLTLGAFFEAGEGNYDSFNDFANLASVTARGSTKFIGGGILGRFDFEKSGPGNFYTELSARFGQVETDFNSSDLLGRSGIAAQYELKSPYYGFHLGVGYLFDLTESASLELYGKYLWNRQKGDDVLLSSSDQIQFKSVDSHRVRAGTRLSFTLNDYITPYVGAAYEHEMDGKASAVAYGRKLPAPELKGGTGIGELGLSISPSDKFNVNLGIQGYLGRREGVSGVVQLKFLF